MDRVPMSGANCAGDYMLDGSTAAIEAGEEPAAPSSWGNLSGPGARAAKGGEAVAKFHIAALLLISGLFIAARLWRLTSYGLYGDEIFSLRLAGANWTELIGGVANDIVHPPLFYMLLKLWMGLGGNSVLWLKLFPALTSIASLVPFFLLCRELKLKPAAIELALGLIAVNAYLVYYSQELRMYSLLLTLAI